MSLLLDTHVWIWSQELPDNLGLQTKRQLEDARVKLYVSPISTLEIARLVAAGRIELTYSIESWIRETIRLLRCTTIEISHRIAWDAYHLPPPFHKDPADRILVSTAQAHDLTILTADRSILGYSEVRSQDARQ